MPTAQFDVLESLDKPAMQADRKDDAYSFWDRLSKERDHSPPEGRGRGLMKYPITRFKSMEVALKEMEPFVRNAVHLQSGKAFKQLGGIRSREVLANWLLSATINAIDNRELMFSSLDFHGKGFP
jgi:hypothetical protein